MRADPTRPSRPVVAAAALLVLAAALSPWSPAAARGDARVSHQVRATITFVKNHRNPFDSRVVWRAFRRADGGDWHRIDYASWRAGAGTGGEQGRDECVRNHGWLPDGRYSFVQYNDYWGSSIKGRAFYLGDKACENGTVRSQLFIHTETGAANRQCADHKGDQLCRWEYPKVNDYRSYGCIKMSPRAIRELTRHYHGWFSAGVRYDTARVRVRVVS